MSIEVVSTVQNLTRSSSAGISCSTSRRRPRAASATTAIYHLLEGLSIAIDMTLVYPPLVARFPFAGSELSRFVESLESARRQRDSIWRSGRPRRPASPE